MKKGLSIELPIHSTAFKGKGVGRYQERAVFVKGAIPGDVVKARIIKKKKNFLEAKLLEIIKASKDRVPPKCQHAGVCGGCSWQQLPYEKQLEYKRQQVEDHVRRIGKCDTPVNDTLPCEQPFYYRNKMEYSFSPRRWLNDEEIQRGEFVDDRGFAAGLHAPGRFDKILNLNECHLQDPISFELLDFVRNYALKHKIDAFDTFEKTGFFRHLVIRKAYHTNDLMINLVCYFDDQDIIKDLYAKMMKRFPSITTFIVSINDQPNPTATGRYQHVLHGPGHIEDHIGPYHFTIDPKAFFQTNTAQAEALYSVVAKFANIKNADVVYDLYCGVGTLTLFLSKYASKIVGIELVDEAIKNARINASKNGVKHAYFVKGDIRDTFNDSLIKKFGHPNILITDPPRAGMHPDVITQLLELKVPNIIYVSCDSSTLARDLSLLSERYSVDGIQPVDMFPQTYHIETVVNLTLKH
ncbi:MAG: 23S rRNA (uracil(1939)-C(5))-methyltransferase RlmD [Bacteroidota bacterium]|nr:23S rRNA (uracil(1939)-C(5))-methyltransferase RlmD [Bacteroidota bacterium]